MSFTLSKFAVARPYVFHLTRRSNLDRIIARKRLESATVIYRAFGRSVPTTKRQAGQELEHAGETVHIRDQSPLHQGNVRLEGGWSFADLIRELNSRVFFWPGFEAGPIDYGLRHYLRYEGEPLAILKVATAILFKENEKVSPGFCKFNSGSPRCSKGLGSARGPDTFICCEKASYTASQAVEVTYRQEALLPSVTMVANQPGGPWKRLF